MTAFHSTHSIISGKNNFKEKSHEFRRMQRCTSKSKKKKKKKMKERKRKPVVTHHHSSFVAMDGTLGTMRKHMGDADMLSFRIDPNKRCNIVRNFDRSAGLKRVREEEEWYAIRLRGYCSDGGGGENDKMRAKKQCVAPEVQTNANCYDQRHRHTDHTLGWGEEDDRRQYLPFSHFLRNCVVFQYEMQIEMYRAMQQCRYEQFAAL